MASILRFSGVTGPEKEAQKKGALPARATQGTTKPPNKHNTEQHPNITSGACLGIVRLVGKNLVVLGGRSIRYAENCQLCLTQITTSNRYNSPK